MNQEIGALLPQEIERIHLDLGNSDVEALSNALLENWRQGALLVHDSGHGGRTQWSSSGILLSEDVPELANGSRLPLVVAMNCLNGYFHHVGATPALGECLLLEPAGGAIAYWGPTAITSNLRQQALAERFYRYLFQPKTETVRRAILLAQRDLAEDSRNREVLDTWILLGDPALRLRY